MWKVQLKRKSILKFFFLLRYIFVSFDYASFVLNVFFFPFNGMELFKYSVSKWTTLYTAYTYRYYYLYTWRIFMNLITCVWCISFLSINTLYAMALSYLSWYRYLVFNVIYFNPIYLFQNRKLFINKIFVFIARDALNQSVILFVRGYIHFLKFYLHLLGILRKRLQFHHHNYHRFLPRTSCTIIQQY